MTLEQEKKLKEIGFPRHKGEWLYNNDGNFLPYLTSEALLEWLRGKLGGVIEIYADTITVGIAYRADGEDTQYFKNHKTLSDAVYALAVWAYENKLLEA